MPPADLETLQVCHAAGRTGSFSISEEAHARARCNGHSPADLRHALGEATWCQRNAGSDGRWSVRGPSLDGTEVILDVVLTSGTLSVV
jgi:hypothetical protein